MSTANVLHYWPYCPDCKKPFSFSKDEPFAFCDCGTSEWGHPRPAEWVLDPSKVVREALTTTQMTTMYQLLKEDPRTKDYQPAHWFISGASLAEAHYKIGK